MAVPLGPGGYFSESGREQQMAARVGNGEGAGDDRSQSGMLTASRPRSADIRRQRESHATSAKNHNRTTGFCVGTPRNDAAPMPTRSPRTVHGSRIVRIGSTREHPPRDEDRKADDQRPAEHPELRNLMPPPVLSVVQLQRIVGHPRQ